MKFDISVFFERLLRKFKFHENRATTTGTLHTDQHSSVISRSVLLRMKKVSDKFVVDIKTHILCSITFFKKNRAVYEIMWKNTVWPQRTLWRMRIACLITKAKHTLTIPNTHCFSTATMVAGTRLNVTLYIHCIVFE